MNTLIGLIVLILVIVVGVIGYLCWRDVAKLKDKGGGRKDKQ